jgi:hypothetical protein
MSIVALELDSWALYVINFTGKPTMAKIFVCKKFMITLLVAFLVGTTSFHLVK